jgi:hypothetical protein
MLESFLPPRQRWSMEFYYPNIIKVFRMPSSSRAYLKPMEEKAEIYRSMFSEFGMV